MPRKMLEKALAVAKASPVCKLQSPAEDQSPLKIKVFMNEECDQYINQVSKVQFWKISLFDNL